MTYCRHTTAIPEEWQHDCEAGAVLAMAKAEREAFFNGSVDENGNRKERGIIAIRGLKSADTLRGCMERLQEARAAKK